MLLNGRESKELLAKAKREHFAIGSFNVFDYMTAEATFVAAEELGVPVMVSTWDYFDPSSPEGSNMPEFAAGNFNHFVLERSKASPVPVIIHLDHTPTYAGCLRGIQNGAASVMIDASMKSIDENIALTKKVVEAARACGVLVEGEIGHVGGHANSSGATYTEVADAKKYVAESGIDLVAVSIGTVHGIYTSEPVLNYKRISELRDAFDAVLVMHGSSGLKPEQFKEAIKNGIVKINFGTYTQLTGGRATYEAAKAMGDKIYYKEIITAGMRAAADYLKEHMVIFGTKKV
jgi:tagatose 1,6-diphosphate aldolase GatY/KbaY